MGEKECTKSKIINKNFSTGLSYFCEAFSYKNPRFSAGAKFDPKKLLDNFINKKQRLGFMRNIIKTRKILEY